MSDAVSEGDTDRAWELWLTISVEKRDHHPIKYYVSDVVPEGDTDRARELWLTISVEKGEHHPIKYYLSDVASEGATDSARELWLTSSVEKREASWHKRRENFTLLNTMCRMLFLKVTLTEPENCD